MVSAVSRRASGGGLLLLLLGNLVVGVCDSLLLL